ncbi:MAG: glycine--tRNA ligase [Ectothiorhodospiraceae bacterium]|nr:glycine--tRNA ligase [Ectothiorhodospiraceae bacterium]
MAKPQQGTLEKIVSLAKRRGFIFQSSEIYGGLNGCWDYGPLGVELLNNVKSSWWRFMTYRDNIEGLDASILMHPRVWEASGHVENFTDPMIDCKQCKSRYRLDVLFESFNEKRQKKVAKAYAELLEGSAREEYDAKPREEQIEISGDALVNDSAVFEKINAADVLACPSCGSTGTFTLPRKFNLMFKTHVGPVEDASNVVFLRPETAQGIFVNFQNVFQATRQKVPFGIAQIGKAFRNEINTKNFLFRTREFEQMEMQFFVKPGTDDEWFERWREDRLQWFIDCGMKKEKLRLEPHPEDKLAHYAKAAVDIEYEFPFGWGEIEGIHNRTDFDLKRHEEYSGKSMEYYETETEEKFVPYVIETSAGASRSLMAFLVDAYEEEELEKETRTVMRFHPSLAPFKAAVLPLVNRDGMDEIGEKLHKDLQKSFKVFYDDSGSIGRRYRRQDEIGTPYCITIDSDTLEDQTVTIRNRDSMEQERIPLEKVKAYLAERIV